jgi:hypothetical protein
VVDFDMRSVVVIMSVFALAGQNVAAAAASEPAHPRTIRESVRRYVPDHPDALAQRPAPPLPRSRKGFPVRAMLIGLGIGCVAGVYWVQSESEGHGDQGINKLRGCAYLGSVGAFTAVMIALH